MRWFRGAVATAVLAVATAVGQASAAAALPVAGTVVCPPVVAHRGAGAGFPSGSRPAFPAAARSGAKTVEFDVRFTRTTVPVVYHDADISAGTNGTGLVSAMSLTQLRRFTIDGTIPGTQPYIPTMWEVLHDAKAAGAQRYLVELKTQPSAAQMDAFLSKINSLGLASRVVVQSFSAATLRDVSKAAPGLKRALIVSSYTDPTLVRRSGTAFVPRYTTVTAAYVKALHRAGVSEVYPWTVNLRASWTDMARLGVTGTMTDLTQSYVRTGCR